MAPDERTVLEKFAGMCERLDERTKNIEERLCRIETKLDEAQAPLAVWKWFMGIIAAVVGGIIIYLAEQR